MSGTSGIKTMRDPLLIQIKDKELGTLCMSIQIK